MGVGEGAGVHARGDEACDVGDIRHQVGPHFVGDLAELGEVDHARVGAVAAENDLGLVFVCGLADGVVVDLLVLRVALVVMQGVVDGVVEDA